MTTKFSAVNKESKRWDDRVYLAHGRIRLGQETVEDIVIVETDKYIRKLERHRQDHKLAKLLQKKVNSGGPTQP